MKRVLITGITGQVGSQLADYILNNTDYEVVGMMRWQEPLDNIYHLTDRINKKDRISIYYADLNDGMSIRRMIEEIRPDYISHLAAQSYPKTSFDIPIETLQTNIIGTAIDHRAFRGFLINECRRDSDLLSICIIMRYKDIYVLRFKNYTTKINFKLAK